MAAKRKTKAQMEKEREELKRKRKEKVNPVKLMIVCGVLIVSFIILTIAFNVSNSDRDDAYAAETIVVQETDDLAEEGETFEEVEALNSFLSDFPFNTFVFIIIICSTLPIFIRVLGGAQNGLY